MTNPNHARRPRREPGPTAGDAVLTEADGMPDRSTARDVEAALLGLAMQAPQRAAHVLGDLTTDDLAASGHRAVLAAIRAVLADGAPPDPALVLAAYHRGQHCGSPMHLFALMAYDCLHHAGTPGTEGHYRRAVLEACWRRDATATAHRIHQAAHTAPLTDLHAVLAESLAALGNTLVRIALTPTPANLPAGSAGTRRAELGATADATTREAA